MAIEAQWMQNRTFSARQDRALIAGLYDEGVMDLLAFKVSEDSPASMRVSVAAGEAVIAGDDSSYQNNYYVQSTNIELVDPIVAPISNPRIDLVVVQVRDPDAGGAVGDDVIVTVVTGTEAASPVAPALPDSAQPLSKIALVPGQTSIVDANLTDVRMLAGLRDTTGVMKPFTGSSNRLPNGWILANGVNRSRADYPRLHAVYEEMGYPYGAGDGSTTFGIPDLRDRVAVAAGPTHFTSIGEEAGNKTISLATGQLPEHVHTGPLHAHTTPLHAHTIDHNHPAASSSPDGGHGHRARIGGGFNFLSIQDSASLSTQEIALSGTSGRAAPTIADSKFFGTEIFTEPFSDHTHSFDLPNLTGTSGDANPTTNDSGTANTGPVGSGSPVNVTQPYAVISGCIIRT